MSALKRIITKRGAQQLVACFDSELRKTRETIRAKLEMARSGGSIFYRLPSRSEHG
jgi:hypothetical protein